MLDDADKDSAAFDPPDPDNVYRNYLVTCRRLGVTPTPRDRANALIREWTDSLAAAAAGRTEPPTTH
jgi:hypothetical protein